MCVCVRGIKIAYIYMCTQTHIHIEIIYILQKFSERKKQKRQKQIKLQYNVLFRLLSATKSLL